MAVINQKIDFDKNRILTPTVQAKSKKMISLPLKSVK